MTLAEAKLGTQRLHEMAEKKWWVEKLRADERGKIIPFPER